MTDLSNHLMQPESPNLDEYKQHKIVKSGESAVVAVYGGVISKRLNQTSVVITSIGGTTVVVPFTTLMTIVDEYRSNY